MSSVNHYLQNQEGEDESPVSSIKWTSDEEVNNISRSPLSLCDDISSEGMRKKLCR